MKRVCCLVFAAMLTLGAARGQGMTQPEGVRALVSGVGALTVAAVLTAVRSGETGSFTLAGRVIPFTLASAAIFAALQWGLDQARIAAASPLDLWNKYGTPLFAHCAYQSDYGRRVDAIFSNGNTVTGMYPNGNIEQYKLDYASGERGGGTWTQSTVCPYGNAGSGTSYWIYSGTPSTKPSLADWIAGTYTPSSGLSAVPHPEAAIQLRELVQQKIVSDNPQSSDEASGSGIGIYPAVPPIEWHLGVPSCAGGSIFDNAVKACVNLTCEAGQLINPASNSCGVPPVCAAGTRRVGSSWACSANPTCPAGSSFDSTTNQCRPDEAACTGGQVRDPYTRQCRAPDGCPTGQIRDTASGQCVAVQCPSGQILDPLTNLCSDSKPTALPATPFDALLAKIGAAITRIVAVGSNKIPFGLASYFPSFSAASSCDQLDVVMDLGTVLGSVTLPICSNMGVVFWHEKIRPLLLAVFSVLGAIWIIRNGLQS